MTPKEKAKELIEKMNVIHYVKLGGKNTNSKGLPVSMHDNQIKQCALIAAKEIIDTIENMSWIRNEEYFIKANFWEDVQKEIELL